MPPQHAAQVFDAIALFALLVVIIAVAAGVLAYARRRMQRRGSARNGAGFDLAQLRRLRESGQLSPEEYDQLVDSLHTDS